jgi:hypothetical protein
MIFVLIAFSLPIFWLHNNRLVGYFYQNACRVPLLMHVMSNSSTFLKGSFRHGKEWSMLASLLVLLVPLVIWISIVRRSSFKWCKAKKIENVRSLSGRGAVGAHNNVFLEQLQECDQYVCPANENWLKKSQNILICLSKMVLNYFGTKGI